MGGRGRGDTTSNGGGGGRQLPRPSIKGCWEQDGVKGGIFTNKQATPGFYTMVAAAAAAVAAVVVIVVVIIAAHMVLMPMPAVPLTGG